MNRYQHILLGALILASSVIWSPGEANASWIELWARADGSYIGGSEELRHFAENDAGPAYGFALGVEVLQIDVFVDINFFPAGSMFNMAGVGFDLDVLPMLDSFVLAPSIQIAYFFAPHEDDQAESDLGLLYRLGLQAEVKLFTGVWLGAEGFIGGLYSMPDAESGMFFSGSGYLMVRFGL